MEPSSQLRRLVVNADDFGASAEINEAVIHAHEDGILTSASLMVNEPSCAAAVRLARKHPGLGVGLHLSLVCGKSSQEGAVVRGFTRTGGRFGDNALTAGCRFFFDRSLRPHIERELRNQFERFAATGLKLDHVNGHLNIHLHPTVLRIVLSLAREHHVRTMRLTFDPFLINWRIARGRHGYRLSHALIYEWLSRRARPLLRRADIRHTDRVFGLLENARISEPFILNLLDHLPPGDSELYCHPSTTEFRHEYDALISARVREKMIGEKITLLRYQDL